MSVDIGVKSITVRKKQYDNFHAGKYAGYDFGAHKWIDFSEWQDLIEKWQNDIADLGFGADEFPFYEYCKEKDICQILPGKYGYYGFCFLDEYTDEPVKPFYHKISNKLGVMIVVYNC